MLIYTKKGRQRILLTNLDLSFQGNGKHVLMWYDLAGYLAGIKHRYPEYKDRLYTVIDGKEFKIPKIDAEIKENAQQVFKSFGHLLSHQ